MIVSAWTIVSVKFLWKFCGGVLLSRTRTVKGAVPTVVGDPPMTPSGNSDNPAGSDPEMTDQL